MSKEDRETIVNEENAQNQQYSPMPNQQYAQVPPVPGSEQYQQYSPVPPSPGNEQYQQYSPVPPSPGNEQYQQYSPAPPAPGSEQYQQYSPVPPSTVKRDRTNEYVLFAVIAAIIIAIGILAVFFGTRLFSDIKDQGGFRFPFFQGNESEFNTDVDRDDEAFDPPLGGYDDEEDAGMESIEPFIAQNLSYITKSELWDFSESTSTSDTYFFIQFPVIDGLPDATIQDRINKEIESIAMASRDLMYPDPIPAIKGLIEEEDFWLESMVDYKITYMDENYISIVFEDHYFLGSVFAEYFDMRSVTFDLKTGEKVSLETIMNITDDFLTELRTKLILEDPTSSVFSDTVVLSDANLKTILSGGNLNGRYSRVFFLSAKGIDIGVCYHYRSADGNIIARGYTTTLFSSSEIEPFIIPNPIWDSLRKL